MLCYPILYFYLNNECNCVCHDDLIMLLIQEMMSSAGLCLLELPPCFITWKKTGRHVL